MPALLTAAEAARSYLAAWNADDADARFAALIEGALESVVLLDPHARLPLDGRGALAAHIAHVRLSGVRHVDATSELQEHHGVLRFTWRMRDGDGVMATGLTIAERFVEGGDADGRIARLIHFVDE